MPGPTKRWRPHPFPWAAAYARPHPPAPAGDIVFQNVSVDPGSGPPHPLAGLDGEKSAPFVEVFGVTAEGATVCARVHGFRPYFYVGLENGALDGATPLERTALAGRIRSRLEALGQGRVLAVEAVRSSSIYGWQEAPQWFWRVTTLLPQTVGKLRDHLHRSPLDGTDAAGPGALADPAFGACHTTYENNVKYAVRFIVDRGWGGMAWARLPAGRWRARRDRTAGTDLEVDVHWRDLEPIEPPAACAPLRVLSFDIETESPTDRYAMARYDPVGCISCACWEREPTGAWRQLPTVNLSRHVPAVPDAAAARQQCWVTGTEAEMLLYFAAFVGHWDPDLITGHNTGHYDWPYLVGRMRALGLDAFDMGDGTTCLHLGRRRDLPIRLETKSMFRMGRVDDYTLVRLRGRCAEFDHLPLAQTNVAKSYDSYKLGDIATKELGYGKEDVGYDQITPLLNGSPDEVWTVLGYCQRDAELPWLLCMVNNYGEGYEAMARLVRVPLAMLVDSGQQVRTQAIMLHRMQTQGCPYLVPYIQPPPAKNGREKGYDGAYVIPPRRGYYRCDDIQAARKLIEAELRGRPRLAPDDPGCVELDYDGPEGEPPPRLLRARALLQADASRKRARDDPEAGADSKRPRADAPPEAGGRKRKRDQLEEELEACLDPETQLSRERKRARQQSPVATLDFASLYPSIMLANNLCYRTHVPPRQLPAARAAGLPLARMPNGEWFIQAWRPVRPDAPAPEGAQIWEKEEVVAVEGGEHEAELRALGFAVAEEDWQERFQNFAPAGPPARRLVARRVGPHWRDDRLVAVLPQLLIDLLAARKKAKGAMGAAGRRAKLLTVARVLNALLVRPGHADDTPEATERAGDALRLLWGEQRHRAFLKDVPHGARLAGRRPVVLLRVMRFLRGDAMAEHRWHDLRAALLEVYAETMAALRQAYPEEPWAGAGELDLVAGEHAAWFGAEMTRWERKHAACDAEQMALKVVCNSVYGFTGATSGKLPCLAISSAVTSVGRAMLQQTSDICTRREGDLWGGCSPYEVRCVYGDSVTGETPVVLRNRRTGEVEVRRIDELGDGWAAWHGDKEAAAAPGWDVWTERGWTAIRRVIRHAVPASKRILEVTTHTGSVRVTDEHSLLRPGATPETERIDAKDVVVGQRIVHADLPVPAVVSDVGEEEARLMGLFFADGTCGDYAFPSGRKQSWRITKGNHPLMEEMLTRARAVHPDVRFELYDIRRSSKTYALTATNASQIQPRYRKLFYDQAGNKRVPACILNASAAVRRAFFEGYYSGDGDKDAHGYVRFDVRGQIGAAGLFQLLASLGEAVSLNVRADKPGIYRLTVARDGRQRPPHGSSDAIKKIREVPHDGCTVYDLETENHHFQAGVGRIVVHNTDSVFLEFVGCPTMAEAFEIAERLAKRCTDSFRSPFIKLELEKIFRRILLMKRKRYEGEKDERSPSGLLGPDGEPIYDVKTSGMSKGSETRRRDVCTFVRETIVQAVRRVFAEGDLEGAIAFVRDAATRLASGEVPYEQLVLSRSVSKHPDDYKVKQAHIALLQRMMRRDQGRTFEIGSRVHYVLTQAGRRAKTGEMAEDPAYAAAHRIPYDATYYLEKQLKKPLVRFFGPFLSGPDVPQKECDARARDVLFGDLRIRRVRLGGVRDGFMADWVAGAAAGEEDDEAHDERMRGMRAFDQGYEPDPALPVFGPAPPAVLAAAEPEPPAKRARKAQAGLDGWLKK